MRSEQEIRAFRERLVESKHGYFGFDVQGLDLYYALRDLIDWVLGEAELRDSKGKQ